MALSRRSVISQVEVTRTGHVQVRLTEYLYEDNQELGELSHHRHVLSPGDALDTQDSLVQTVARAVWTAFPALVQAHKDRVKADEDAEAVKREEALKAAASQDLQIVRAPKEAKGDAGKKKKVRR